MLQKLKMAASCQLQIFLWAQKLEKIQSQKLFEFYYHISHDMEMCRWFFQGLTEIQNSCHELT